MKRAGMLALFVAVGVIGCASGGMTNNPASNAGIITRGEIVSAGSGNAYEIIRRLRPNFLRAHGATTVGQAQELSAFPNVYLDGLMYGDINSLRNIDATQMDEVRMYGAAEAQTRFGSGNSNGVIAITSRK